MLKTPNNVTTVRGSDTTKKFCNLKPKCLKCAEHFTSNSPFKSGITCISANCDVIPAFFRGCKKNPLNINKTSPPNNKTNNKNSNSRTKQTTQPPKVH